MEHQLVPLDCLVDHQMVEYKMQPDGGIGLEHASHATIHYSLFSPTSHHVSHQKTRV